MSGNSIKQLFLDGQSNLLGQIAKDFSDLSTQSTIPSNLSYKVASRQESPQITQNARVAALGNYQTTFVKRAFDTRRTNQDTERNPRTNLQYWNRSQEFIEEEDQRKVDIFAKLLSPLNDIKAEYGNQPEYLESYARKLHELVSRALRVEQDDQEYYRPQFDYLEQLLFNRYRLSMEELSLIKKADIKKMILKKDEDLKKRGQYLKETDDGLSKQSQQVLVKDGDGKTAQESLVNAIFGNNGFRRDGEKTVTRTITITIKDEAQD